MKKFLLSLSIVLSGYIIVQEQQNTFIHGNSSGAPAGHSGAPCDASGRTCNTSGCHTGGPAVQTMTGWITHTVPSDGYTPGQAYSITVTAINIGKTRFGFQATPQKANGTQVGSMMPGADGQTAAINSGKYITHTSAGATSGAADSKTWTFFWNAPATGEGDVTIYAAFNCSNNDNLAMGDEIFKSSITISQKTQPADTTSVTELSKRKVLVSVYPNPVAETLFISNETKGNKSISVLDLSGKTIISPAPFTSDITTIDVASLSKGLYFVSIQGVEFTKPHIQSFIKL
jgi:hypothetical protein